MYNFFYYKIQLGFSHMQTNLWIISTTFWKDVLPFTWCFM